MGGLRGDPAPGGAVLTSSARPTAAELLGPGGRLAAALPGWEHRADQVAMAEAVERAIERREYLVAEAGTGTGKTLAYLVPAILSGRRVIVSTATKTLQEQIWGKDIPLIREALGLEFTAAYLKGRANYYCLERGAEFARAPTFAAREEAALWPRIEAWAQVTDTGDRSEVDLPDQFQTWRDLSATSENCLGRECRRYEECFVTRARALAAQADVLLVNHHLFFADLAMRTSRAGVEILPDHDVVVFDEAQALEDVATEYFGLQVSSYRVEELSRDALRAVADRPDLATMLKEATGELRRSGERLFQEVADALRDADGAPRRAGHLHRHPHRGGGFGRGRRLEIEEGARAALSAELLEPAQRSLARLDGALSGLRDLHADAPSPALSQIARRAGELRVELAAVTAMKEPSRIYFGEVRGRGVFLRAAPIGVAEELQERLYRHTDTIVFTSATLAAQGRFDYFRRQAGLAPEFEVEDTRPGRIEFEEAPLTGESYPVTAEDRREKVHARGPNILLLVLFVIFGVLLVAAIAYFVYRSLPGPRVPPLSTTGVTAAPAAQEPQPAPAAQAAPAAQPAPAAQAAPAPQPAPAPAVTKPKPAASGGVTYRIKNGDTLWDIAATYYRNPWLYPKLAKANSIRNPDLIFAGTRIKIPEN